MAVGGSVTGTVDVVVRVVLVVRREGRKLRRYVQANVLRQDTGALLARRRGECNRCGACCMILFRCPFLGTDEAGQYTCRIYEQRFAQCRLFPLHAADLRDVAAADGMDSLRSDAIDKVQQGVTTVEEVIRVTAEGR